MKVFDFDNTIYKGESVVDFFLFSMKKKKSLIKYVPIMLYTAVLYKLEILSIDNLSKLSGKLSKAILKNNKEAETFIKEFWSLNNKKLDEYYLSIIKPEDVIITASPRILIDGVKDKLNTNNIICSELNLETGKLDFICFRNNKVKAFKENYPNTQIDEFYTDSNNDVSLMEISKTTHLVKRKRIKR